MKLLSALGWIMGFLLALPADAELQIEVTQGADDAVNIAVVPFGWLGRGELPEELHRVIASDFQLSEAGVLKSGSTMRSKARPTGRVPVAVPKSSTQCSNGARGKTRGASHTTTTTVTRPPAVVISMSGKRFALKIAI